MRDLHEHFQHINPSLTRIKFHLKHYVDKILHTCTHVWLENDSTKSPLQAKHPGRFCVLKRTDQVFTIEMKDSLKQASIGRPKVARLPASSDFSANVSSPYHSFVPSAITTRSGRFVGGPLDFLISCTGLF